MGNLDTALTKVGELKDQLAELASKYPLSDKTELNAFVDTVEAWEAEAEKIVNVARANTQESRTEAAALIASDCSPRLQDAAAKGDALAKKLENEQDKIIDEQSLTSNIAIGVIVAALVIAIVVVLRMALIISLLYQA